MKTISDASMQQKVVISQKMTCEVLIGAEEELPILLVKLEVTFINMYRDFTSTNMNPLWRASRSLIGQYQLYTAAMD